MEIDEIIKAVKHCLAIDGQCCDCPFQTDDYITCIDNLLENVVVALESVRNNKLTKDQQDACWEHGFSNCDECKHTECIHHKARCCLLCANSFSEQEDGEGGGDILHCIVRDGAIVRETDCCVDYN